MTARCLNCLSILAKHLHCPCHAANWALKPIRHPSKRSTKCAPLPSHKEKLLHTYLTCSKHLLLPMYGLFDWLTQSQIEKIALQSGNFPTPSSSRRALLFAVHGHCISSEAKRSILRHSMVAKVQDKLLKSHRQSAPLGRFRKVGGRPQQLRSQFDILNLAS